MRINTNQSEKHFESRLLKIAWNLIRLNPIQSETSVQMNPNEYEVNFQSEWIRINPDTDWFPIRMNQCSDWISAIPNHSDICIRVNTNQYEPIRKTFWISFVEKSLKINTTQSDSIRDFCPNESERLRSKFSIGMNQNQSGHGLISNPNEPVFGLNQRYSESFRYLYPSQCESIRTNPKNILNLVCWKELEN